MTADIWQSVSELGKGPEFSNKIKLTSLYRQRMRAQFLGFGIPPDTVTSFSHIYAVSWALCAEDFHSSLVIFGVSDLRHRKSPHGKCRAMHHEAQ